MNTKAFTKITLADNYAADKRSTVIAKTSYYLAPLYYITKNQLAAAERRAGMLGGSCMRIATDDDSGVREVYVVDANLAVVDVITKF